MKNNMIMETKKIEIEVPVGKTAKWIGGVLTLVDEKVKDLRPITDKVKTFEDACKELGDNHPLILHYDRMSDSYLSEAKDIVAYMKLRIICAALNEGWKPEFTKNEYRYYPWFSLYTKDEIEKMSEDKRKELVLWDGSAYCGLAGAGSFSDREYSSSHICSRLCLKSETIAVYCGKQFINIWADFVLTCK